MSSVGTIANVDKVPKLRRVDFLVLRGEQETSHSNELKLRPRDFGAFQVSIDEVDSQIKRLGHKLELQMDFDQPVHQNGSHAFVDVGLTFHVSWANRGFKFFATVVCVHVFDVVGHAERIFLVTFVNVIHGSGELVRGGVGLDGTDTFDLLRSDFHNHGIFVGSECIWSRLFDLRASFRAVVVSLDNDWLVLSVVAIGRTDTIVV